MALPEDRDEAKQAIHYDAAGIPILGPPPKDRDAEETAERKAHRTYEDKQTALQVRILITQVGLLLLGLIGAGVSLWQSRIAQESADTSDKAVLLAQKSERDGNRVSERQIRQSEDSLKAALAANQISEDAFRLSSQPWVGLKRVFLAAEVSRDGRLIVSGELQNTGPSPAIRYRAVYALDYGAITPSMKTIRRRIEMGKATAKGVIAPQGIGSFELDGPPIPRQQALRELTSSAAKLYVFGRIYYADKFATDHVTTFCLFFSPPADGFVLCPELNDMK